MAYNNPVFSEGSISDGDIQGEDENILQLAESVDRLRTIEETRNLDLKKLNSSKRAATNAFSRWRNGPASITDRDHINDVKIGSLKDTIGRKISKNKNTEFLKLEWENTDEEDKNSTANNLLISYFAFLGMSSDRQKADFLFIDNILKYADVNAKDEYGQTLMHEVAREWSTDFAKFLKIKGIDIDVADKWGRTPLFVATAHNYVDMVEWLVLNGANIYHRTMKGEQQSVIHYAAKYDAVDVFILLVKLGANPLERDCKERTPLFVAAESGQKHICSYMLDLGLPVASYDENAVSIIEHIIAQMPTSIAYAALNQFISTNKINGKKKYYLSCFGKRRFVLLERTKKRYRKPADNHTALEILIQRDDTQLVTHPAILKLIDLKTNKFGKRLIRLNVAINFLYTLLWTITVIIPEKRDNQWSKRNISQICLSSIAQIIAVYQLYLHFDKYDASRKRMTKEKERILEQCKCEKKFCHPRWIIEKYTLKKTKESAKRLTTGLFAETWNIIDFFSLLLGTGAWIITLLNISLPKLNKINSVWKGYCSIFILFAWLRLNRHVRYEQSLGRFIAMLEESAVASFKSAFLFFEFFIPFVVCFWVLFGGEKKGSSGSEYEAFYDLVYQLYLLAIVGDYEYDYLKDSDVVTSQILVGLYFILLSTITLNLLVAMFTEAFIRINETAVANARLREAEEILEIERRFPEKKKEFEIYLNQYCAPLTAEITREISQSNKKDRSYGARQALTGAYYKLRKLNPEMNTIIKEQELFKHCFNSGEKMLKDFKIKYRADVQHDIRSQLHEVLKFQDNVFNVAQRRTRNTISRLVDRTVFAFADINDGSLPTE